MTMAALAIPMGNMLVGGLLMFAIGVPYAAGAFLLRAMMADIGDEERLKRARTAPACSTPCSPGP